jgi:hypothetical protein
VGLPKVALEETDPAHEGQVVRNRFECPSPAKRKRPRTYLAESGQIAARKDQRGNAALSRSSAESDDGRDEEDQKPSLMTSNSAQFRV